MGRYRILYAEHSHPGTAGHGHVVAVWVVAGRGLPPQRLTSAEVRERMRTGEVFYTVDGAGNGAEVRRYDCWCGATTIHSAPGATVWNNLENLPEPSMGPAG